MAGMDKDALKQIEFLAGYIRDSKRKVIIGAIVVSIVCVLLFVVGSYYLLFRFYERMTEDYYASLLRGVSSFQDTLIQKSRYRDDIKQIASAVQRYRGVKHVWFTDRSGRLVYSTDADLLEQYRQKRLPSQYFESVQRLWQFENGYPVPGVVPITRFLSQRFSVPIYAYGHEEYDFVMGIDAARFVYLPQQTDKLILISAGYIVVFASLLFFPLLIMVTGRFNSLAVRARMMFSSFGPAPGKPEEKEEPAPQEPAPQQEPASFETPLQEGVETASREPAAPAPAEEQEEEVEGKEVPDNRLALFIKKKKEIFMREDLQLPFIHASSHVHHSDGIEGTYIYTHRSGEKIYFVSFVSPGKDEDSASARIDELISFFNEQIEACAHVKDFTGKLNRYCLENSLELNLSLIAVDAKEKNVRYSSFGTGRAIYTKKGEEKTKDLILHLPNIGTSSEKKFSEGASYADIRFEKDDLFMLLPQNIGLIDAVGEGLLEAIKEDLLGGREQSAFDLSSSIGMRFQALSDIQQTGFVIIKFV
jgi:hypothetical protein